LKQFFTTSAFIIGTFFLTNSCSKSGSTTAPTNNGTTTGQIMVSTFAGSLTKGNINGTGTTASFNGPVGLCIDAAGNIYVADANNNQVRKITTGGVVSTYAGSGAIGETNGTLATTTFNSPFAIVFDASGNMFVGDEQTGGAIRKITSAGVVSTFYPNAYADCLAMDASGNMYGSSGNAVFKITPAGVMTVLAGSGKVGAVNATGSNATFYIIQGVACDAAGNVYVADSGNNLIRKVTPAGVVTTYAGLVKGGYADGPVATALFSTPSGVAVDAAGNLYVSDSSNSMIRKITPAGMVSTIAGTGAIGYINGVASSATFNNPVGIAVDATGNIYVAEENDVRKITFP